MKKIGRVLWKVSSLQIADLCFNEDKNSNNFYFAFFTGKLSFSYTLIELFKATRNKKYIIWAANIAKESKNHLTSNSDPIIDLINGVSGILLALLHLHNEGVKEDWLLKDIAFFVDYIISKAELSYFGGVYWDKTKRIQKGLTGFSHGASGIGFVFFELYKLTHIEEFKKLSYRTFDYENESFNEEKTNWIDYRNYYFTELERINFLKQASTENTSFFSTQNIMQAWCHGSPGILLSRHLTAYEDENVAKALPSIILGLKNESYSNHSLCHSQVGNALILMSLNVVEASKLKPILFNICLKLIEHFNKEKSFKSGYRAEKQTNYSLFMGNLGIFYFMLKVYIYLSQNQINNNILYPHIKKYTVSHTLKKKLYKYEKEDSIATLLLKNHYPRTLFFIKKEGIELQFKEKNIEEQLFNFIKDKVHSKITTDAFKYESSIRDAEKKMLGFSYSDIRREVDKIKLKEKNTILPSLRVKVNSEVNFISCLWGWDSKTNPKWTMNNEINSEEIEYFIIPSWKTKVLVGNKFLKMLFNYIIENKEVLIKDVLSHFTNLISPSPDKLKEAERLILKNVLYLINTQIIRIVHDEI